MSERLQPREDLDVRDFEDEARPLPPAAAEPAPRVKRRRWTRGGSLIVDLHNVAGLFAAAAVIVVSATGVLLNHLETFGVSGSSPPPTAPGERAPLEGALAVPDIVKAAQDADARGGGEVRDLDRAIWTPSDGTVEVRLDGEPIRAATVDDATGEVLDMVDREDLLVTQAHSGELISKPWVILSDIAGVLLIVSLFTGVIVWRRRVRSRRRLVGARGGTAWIRANWWFHLVGGLTAAAYLLVMSVTGILLNHKTPLGFMNSSPELPERAADFQPLAVQDMVRSAITYRGGEFTAANVASVDYRPDGYAKVRFDDNEYEVIVDAADGSIERAARRWDVWIEDLHSGLLFGSKGWLLADIPAAIAILLAINGAYLWTRPGWRARDARAKEA